MALEDTADRLRADIQYLRDLAYLSQGADVTLRGPSLKALIENLTKTLIEINAASGAPDPVFTERMEAVRKRATEAQATLNNQATKAAEAQATLNRPISEGSPPTDPTPATQT